MHEEQKHKRDMLARHEQEQADAQRAFAMEQEQHRMMWDLKVCAHIGRVTARRMVPGAARTPPQLLAASGRGTPWRPLTGLMTRVMVDVCRAVAASASWCLVGNAAAALWTP